MGVAADIRATTAWAIDSSHSAAEFAIKHLVFATTKGRFGSVNGTIWYDEGNFANSRVEATIDAASITTHDENRDAHLRSPDFFDVATFPEITFVSTEIIPGKDQRFTLVGDLTMHGYTNLVEIDAEFAGRGKNPYGIEVIGFSGTTKISRKDYGLTWNAALETGGLAVGDEVKISLELEANPRQ